MRKSKYKRPLILLIIGLGMLFFGLKLFLVDFNFFGVFPMILGIPIAGIGFLTIITRFLGYY